jgi:Rieske 2Fe-2S family protein
MRHLLVGDTTSMTATGASAIKSDKRLGGLTATGNIGVVPFYHYPSTWNHFQADHAVSFRVLPCSPTETEVVTTWYVPADAEEGNDYDIETLTAVWQATNQQDQDLVERVQKGVSSPAFVPGRYNEEHELGVIEFADWYSGVMTQRLNECPESSQL